MMPLSSAVPCHDTHTAFGAVWLTYICSVVVVIFLNVEGHHCYRLCTQLLRVLCLPVGASLVLFQLKVYVIKAKYKG